MASEQVLESLVVKLTADNAQILKTLQSTIGAVQSFATKAVGLLGITLSVKGFYAMSKTAEAAELSIKQLEIAIRTNGGAVAQTVAEYRAFAEQVAKSTTLTKGDTLSMLKRAEVMGFSGKEAEAIVKNSIALAGALGGEASEHEQLAIALARGNLQMVKRALHMKHTATDAEVLAQVEKTLNAGLEQSAAAGNTNEAVMARLSHTFDGLKNKIGGVIASGLTPLLDALVDLADEYKDVEKSTQSFWDKAREGALTLGLVWQFEVKNIGRMFEWVVAEISYWLVRLYNTWEDAMTRRLPHLAKQGAAKVANVFGAGVEVPADLPTRKEGPLEAELRRNAERLGNDIGSDMDKYVQEGLKKYNARDQQIARQKGEGIGKALQKGLGLEKIEGTLAFSVEGLQKVTQFFATGRVGESKADANHRESLGEAQKQTELLKGIVKGVAGGSAGIGLGSP